MSGNASTQDNFLSQAASSRTGLANELWSFLMHNKKWWLLPIVGVLLLMGALVFLSSAGLAPFIYTIF